MSDLRPQRKYDSTVARIAGNVYGHLEGDLSRDEAVRMAVDIARAIVAEVQRTEPTAETEER